MSIKKSVDSARGRRALGATRGDAHRHGREAVPALGPSGKHSTRSGVLVLPYRVMPLSHRFHSSKTYELGEILAQVIGQNLKILGPGRLPMAHRGSTSVAWVQVSPFRALPGLQSTQAGKPRWLARPPNAF